VQLQPVNQQASLVLVPPPVQAQNARAQAQAVVAAQNVGRRKQTRYMLQRYKELPTAISPHPFMIKAPAHPDDEVVAVGKTNAFFFAPRFKRAPRIEVCFGGVHMLIAVVSGSKVTNDAVGSKRGKRSLKYIFL
jgi:hypothetical protein